ncbi:MAG: DUF3268 family zinc-finger domain-containing protein [candidate division KSB1 bacterium]|nr:DUF3268 family zinc-finger domain-containing protein [candidate division KSB1 bacterium]
MEVKCDYCRKPARLVTGDVIYPHRTDLYNKKFWYCAACDAWVGCHSNSRLNKPLGRLANAELREWKQRAHAAFDPLWIRKMEKEACSKADAIKAGQKWLAEKLGIAISECHIGMFDVEQCQAVVKICETNKKGSA